MIEVNGREVQVEGRVLKVAHLDAEKYFFLDDPEPFVSGLRRIRKRIDIFTFVQRPTEPEPRYRYPMGWENLAVLQVSTFEHWWNTQIDFKTRYIVKKAERRGVQTREVPLDDDLARGIWEIYNEVPIRQGRKFYHFGKDLETVCKESATYPEHSVFVGAFVDSKLIGFIRLLLSADRSHAGFLNIVSLSEYRDKSPTNALVAHAVRFCADHKIHCLTYGTFSYGRRQHDSVSDFKRHNGFQRVDIPRYYIPLTLFGWVGFRLGLHKELLDWIPEPVIVKYRDLRSRWYSRRMRNADKAR